MSRMQQDVLARWSLLLQQNNFEIVYRPGKEHSNADSLSRPPYETKQLFLTFDSFYIGQDGLLYHLDRNQKRGNEDPFSQLVIP